MPRLSVARPEQIRFILGQSHAIWGAGLDVHDYGAMWEELRHTAWGERWFRYLVLAGDDGAVLSSLKLYRPEIRIGGRTSRACAIGAVFTPPALRGRGYAATMIRLVLDEARAAGAASALLFSDIAPSYYEALGFERLAAEESFGTLLGDLPRPEEGLVLRPLEEEDVPAVAGVHRAWCASREVALLRDEDHWRFVLHRAGAYFAKLDGSDLSMRFRVAVRSTRFAGYLVAVDGGEEWSVREVGALDGRLETVASILRLGAFEARGRGMRRVHGWIVPGHERLVPEWKLRREPRRTAIPMVAALDEPTAAALSRAKGEIFFPYLDQF